MNEAGDPTQKYDAIRDLVKMYLPLPNVSHPLPDAKMEIKSIQLNGKFKLFSKTSRKILGSTIFSNTSKTFEQLNQYSGFILYETTLPSGSMLNKSTLSISDLRDRAYVYVNHVRTRSVTFILII